MLSRSSAPSHLAPVLALVLSAVVWGLIWYPYRMLSEAGIGGELATLLTYLVALIAALPLLARERPQLVRPGLLLAIALAAAVANLGYVLALLEGRVVVVLLLFYLAPLWTLGFARWLLGEPITRLGLGTVLLGLAGAGIMLWRPETGALQPRLSEWLGLLAGLAFALCNVLLRRARGLSVALRSTALFAGVCILATVALGLRTAAAPVTGVVPANVWWLILAVGLVLAMANGVLQYGLAHVPANQAIVILLIELPIAALAAYLLAGETLRLADWLGGGLIVLASLAASEAKELKAVDSARQEGA